MTTNEPTVQEWARVVSRAKIAGGYEHRHADDGKWWAHPENVACLRGEGETPPDPVSLPPHYRHLPVECIDVAEHFNFCMGNALKYIWRADHKGNPEQDIAKAIWYLQRELERRNKNVR